MTIRRADAADRAEIWRVLEQVVRAGETYPLPRDLSADDTLAFWFAPNHTVYVAVDEGVVAGTYFLRANQRGGGAHVANCGYATNAYKTGRGVASAMCVHSLEEARRLGFTAMQFNFVVATNVRAVALWQRCGFEIVGRLPRAFAHPVEGPVDALVMYRFL